MAELKQGVKYVIEAEDQASDKAKSVAKATGEALRPMEPIIAALNGNFEGAAQGLLKMAANMKKFAMSMTTFALAAAGITALLKSIQTLCKSLSDAKDTADRIKFDNAALSVSNLRKQQDLYTASIEKSRAAGEGTVSNWLSHLWDKTIGLTYGAKDRDLERAANYQQAALRERLAANAEEQSAAEARLQAAKAKVSEAWGWYRDKSSMARQLEEEKANAAAEAQFEKDFDKLTFHRDWRTMKGLSVDEEATRRVGLAREEEAAAQEAAAETAKNTQAAAESLARIEAMIEEGADE